ncbi:lipocalin family protein [uncultured Zobellia sp.]|uniref:lipocalin family protein n=1 Tax=uncultured Zobellia sp. TaxID=255433 RepID=UPI0025971247|nr:lipocalin family protein [uncultured Zobellia sp.]
MNRFLLLTLVTFLFSCSNSSEENSSTASNNYSELLVGKWTYVSYRTNGGSTNPFVHSGEDCSNFQPDYIEFTKEGRYIQFAYLNCEEDFVVDKLYKLNEVDITVTDEKTGDKAFDSKILEISENTLILRTEVPNIILEESFKKIK